MKTIKTLLTEAKDLLLYNRLLVVLGGYCDTFPATGIDRLFDAATEKGKKIIPKDKQALLILQEVLWTRKQAPSVEYDVPDDWATIVGELLNLRFSDLPATSKPVIKKGRKLESVFWSAGGVISDKVRSLIDFEGTGKSGFWCDVEGKKVEILDKTIN